MSCEAYIKVRDELASYEPSDFKDQLAWDIAQIMHGKAIYHYDPITVEISIDEEDLDEDDHDAMVGIIIHSGKLNARWPSEYEPLELLGQTAESDVRKKFHSIIYFLMDNFASQIDTELPDDLWMIGIDPATAAWTKDHLTRDQILTMLKGLTSSGQSTYADPPGGKVTTHGDKVTGGASIRMVGLLATSSIDLGQGVNYRNGIIVIPGTLPETVSAQLLGKNAFQVIDHPLMAGAGIVRQIFDRRMISNGRDITETFIVLDRPIIDIDSYMADIGPQKATYPDSNEFS